MVIRRVDPLSAGKIAGLLYAMIGLLFGAVFSVIGMAGATFASEAGDGAPFLGALFGVGAIIALPIFYGVLGFIAFAIGAVLYNVLAGMVGGLRVEVE
jgi:hypothetical protein